MQIQEAINWHKQVIAQIEAVQSVIEAAANMPFAEGRNFAEVAAKEALFSFKSSQAEFEKIKRWGCIGINIEARFFAIALGNAARSIELARKNRFTDAAETLFYLRNDASFFKDGAKCAVEDRLAA